MSHPCAHRAACTIIMHMKIKMCISDLSLSLSPYVYIYTHIHEQIYKYIERDVYRAACTTTPSRSDDSCAPVAVALDNKQYLVVYLSYVFICCYLWSLFICSICRIQQTTNLKQHNITQTNQLPQQKNIRSCAPVAVPLEPDFKRRSGGATCQTLLV